MAAESTYEVVRDTVVDAPPERIYRELVDFHRWQAWSPWEDVDPDMERTFGGSDSGLGATYAWQGNRKAGSGSMAIVDVAEPTSVGIELEFLKPFKAHNKVRFTLDASGSADGTSVTWTMTGKKTFMTRVMGIFTSMDKVVGKDFEKGLARLKSLAEGGA